MIFITVTSGVLLPDKKKDQCLKARTHRQILSGLAAESAVESANSAADSSKIGVSMGIL